MKCPVCGRPGRVLHVDEKDPEGVKITWLCANPACSRYKQACGEEMCIRDREEPIRVLIKAHRTTVKGSSHWGEKIFRPQ